MAALRSALVVICVTAAELIGTDLAHPIGDVVAVVGHEVVLQRLTRAGLADELELQLDRLLDPGLRLLETIGDGLLGDERRAVLVVVPGPLGAAGLDHHDGDVAVVEDPAGHDELERGEVALLPRRVRGPLALGGERHADSADGALERDAAEHQRRAGGVDGEHVVRVLHVGTEDGGDDLGLVAVAVGERRAQRAVGEPAGEDGLVGGTALPAEERAGDLPGRVHPLLDVDGEGEEVDPLPHALVGVGGDQHDGFADAGGHGTLRLLRKLAGLKGEVLFGAAYRAADGDGVCHFAPCFLSGAGGGPVPSCRAPRM